MGASWIESTNVPNADCEERLHYEMLRMITFTSVLLRLSTSIFFCGQSAAAFDLKNERFGFSVTCDVHSGRIRRSMEILSSPHPIPEMFCAPKPTADQVCSCGAASMSHPH